MENNKYIMESHKIHIPNRQADRDLTKKNIEISPSMESSNMIILLEDILRIPPWQLEPQ